MRGVGGGNIQVCDDVSENANININSIYSINPIISIMCVYL